VSQIGEPSAVFLLNCSADTMSGRLQCRGKSTSGFNAASDTESTLQQRAEIFCSDSQAVAAHYERKRLLHTVRVRANCHCSHLFEWSGVEHLTKTTFIPQMRIQTHFVFADIHEEVLQICSTSLKVIVSTSLIFGCKPTGVYYVRNGGRKQKETIPPF